MTKQQIKDIEDYMTTIYHLTADTNITECDREYYNGRFFGIVHILNILGYSYVELFPKIKIYKFEGETNNEERLSI